MSIRRAFESVWTGFGGSSHHGNQLIFLQPVLDAAVANIWLCLHSDLRWRTKRTSHVLSVRLSVCHVALYMSVYLSYVCMKKWPEGWVLHRFLCTIRCTVDWFSLWPLTQIVHDQIISFMQFTCVWHIWAYLTISNLPSAHLFSSCRHHLLPLPCCCFFTNWWAFLLSPVPVSVSRWLIEAWRQQQCRVAEDRGGERSFILPAPAFLIQWLVLAGERRGFVSVTSLAHRHTRAYLTVRNIYWLYPFLNSWPWYQPSAKECGVILWFHFVITSVNKV